MRRVIAITLALLAIAGVGALPVVGDGEPCTTIERDGHIYVYPENCIPQNGGGNGGSPEPGP